MMIRGARYSRVTRVSDLRLLAYASIVVPFRVHLDRLYSIVFHVLVIGSLFLDPGPSYIRTSPMGIYVGCS